MFDEKSISIFSSRDQIRQQIIDYTKEYMELESIDLNKTSYLSYLINILSGLTSNLLYYSTSIYREMFMTKAMQRESVLNLAAAMGYSPDLATPAQATILVTIPFKFKYYPARIVLDNGFKYYSGSTIFTQTSKYVIDLISTGGTIVATMTEYLSIGGALPIKCILAQTATGYTVSFLANTKQTESYVSEKTIPELGPYEFYTLPVTFTGQVSEIGLITTETTGGTPEIWTEYDSLFLIPTATNGFTKRLTDTGMDIFFGNGVVGNQPPSGHLCKITITKTLGTTGNVISGSINKCDKIYFNDTDGNESIRRVIQPTVVNVQPGYGGLDIPTTDEVRSLAVSNMKSRDRLVSELDYQDVNDIIPGLPTNHLVSILKRSDLKCNEIVTFMDLIYNESIVPTRNYIWEFDETDNPELLVLITDTIEIDGLFYYSMFNIEIITDTKSCLYYYLLDEEEKGVTITQSYLVDDEVTPVLPTTSKYKTVTLDEFGVRLPEDEQKLEIELKFNEIVADPAHYPDLNCEMITSWDGTTYPMTRETINPGTEDEYDVFAVELNLEDIPQGELTFEYKMYTLEDMGGGSFEAVYMHLSNCKMTIKELLDEFMQSKVEITGTAPNRHIKIYDVPIIRKTYYDDPNLDKSDFNQNVLSYIIAYNPNDYKMMTDFMNIKFSDTTGTLDNMRYNLISRKPVKNVNPNTLPIMPSNEERYAVSNIVNPWSRTPPFIAQYVSSTMSWVFEKLNVNDMFEVTDLSNKMLYTGDAILEPELTIPIAIHAVVWKDTAISTTDTSLITTIKTNLVDSLYTRFGFDKNIYLSEIINIIQTTPGVANCKLLSPTHDIFFNFDIRKDLTQQQLLEYTPQLVWFDTTNINIEVM